MFFRDGTRRFYRGIGWNRIGYAQEPIHVFNDEYTAHQLSGPFDRAWQGVQKHQQEADMVTTWDRQGYRNSFQTRLAQSQRYQQYGSYEQIRGAWGPVPATAMMQSPTLSPQQTDGLLADFVRSVKKTWKNANA